MLAAARNVSSLTELVAGGLNIAVTPVGSPVACRLTLLLEPLAPVTVIFVLTLEPMISSSELAELVIVNAGCGIVKTSAVVRTNAPDFPVTVTA